MDNPKKLATLGTQDTGQRLEKTEEAIKNTIHGQNKTLGLQSVSSDVNVTNPMLPVSLNCPFLIAPSVFSNLCPVSCVPNVASFFEL
jgi:hypothetical protein